MAGATAAPVVRYSVTSIKPSNRIISSFSRSANLSFKHQISRIHRLKSQTPNSRSSRITTCHGTVFDEFFDDDESCEEDEETESSLDLLFRFLESMFKKISKRAKKAARSLLPVAMSPQLLSFAVDGGFLLASLSILKAFLEVICTLGGSVFVGILLLRVILATISYFQSNGNGFNQEGSSYGTTQSVS